MLRVAVVGGGPTGLYALRELLRTPAPICVVVYEASDTPGLGTPYDPRRNHKRLLANIASFEIPAPVDTLAQWLAALPRAARAQLGVGEVSERAFYPRVALGAYFAAQYRKLVAQARRLGHRVTLMRRAKVVDIGCAPDRVRIVHAAPGGRLVSASFDYALLATGHRSRPPRRHPLTAPAYPAPEFPRDRPLSVAVLGASLTAIDAALALAFARGEFVSGAEGLRYAPAPDAAPLRIEMLSRRGVLPEADFYFPYPYEPLRFSSARALRRLRRAPRERLDLAFALLVRELRAADPAYARTLGLDALTVDTFADAYFAARASAEPFVAARRNLVGAKADAAARRVSAYRYCLLRAHEAFAALVPHLSQRDRARFQRGLQRVFVDNYAAVPPLSVERLLALHDAGALGLRRVADGCELRKAGEGVEIVGVGTYDLVIEARGERVAGPRELPFPTLRLQVLANAAGERLPVDEALRLVGGVNPVGRMYCLAAPFLLDKRPFVQGLTAAAELAGIAVADLLRRADAPPAAAPEAAVWADGLAIAMRAA